jgi:hypothetical protein
MTHFINISKKLSIQGYFTGRERTHAQFFLVGVSHDSVDFARSPGSVIRFPALFAHICRYIFDHDDFSGSVRHKFRCSFAEFSFA